MPRYTLIVATQPVDGEREAYDRWYDHTHLGEVLELDGFVSARRLIAVDAPDAPANLALYEIDAEDVSAAYDALARLQAAPLTTTPALDPTSVTFAMYCAGVAITPPS